MPTKKQKESDEVSVTLAHPLPAHYAVGLGLEDQDYDVESDVTVRRDVARSLINAGFVADTDPNDRDAVASALGLDADAVVAPAATESASTGAGTGKGK